MKRYITIIFHRALRLGVAAMLMAGASVASAQSSLPAPGSGGGRPGGVGGGFGGSFGGNSLPAPGSGGQVAPPPGGPGFGGPAWGSPWGPSVVNPPFSVNQGTTTVIACGYDSYGVWRTIPLRVAYAYNGIQYNVTVLNAWNPWTDMWVRGIDSPAYNTSYYLRGNTYNFYTVLPTGTYYFNL